MQHIDIIAITPHQFLCIPLQAETSYDRTPWNLIALYLIKLIAFWYEVGFLNDYMCMAELEPICRSKTKSLEIPSSVKCRKKNPVAEKDIIKLENEM